MKQDYCAGVDAGGDFIGACGGIDGIFAPIHDCDGPQHGFQVIVVCDFECLFVKAAFGRTEVYGRSCVRVLGGEIVLKVHDVGGYAVGGQFGQVFVSVGVVADLVAFRNHTIYKFFLFKVVTA